MTAHDHPALVPGCARCELSVDEAIAAAPATSEPDRLAQIEARLAAATPGPWEADVFPVRKRSRKTGRVLAYRPEDGTVGSVSVIPSDGVYGVMDGPDAELIAHAPEDIAALLAVVKAVRTQAEGWAAKAPDDDWGEDIAQTIVADAGRSILATLDAALNELEES